MIHDLENGVVLAATGVFTGGAELDFDAGYLDKLYYGDGYSTWRGKFQEWQTGPGCC